MNNLKSTFNNNTTIMKAIEILNCVLWRNDTEGMGIANVPQDCDTMETWWMDFFGCTPTKPLADGKYLYYYTVGTEPDDWLYDGNKRFEPDGIAESGVNSYGETDYILLYRIDD